MKHDPNPGHPASGPEPSTPADAAPRIPRREFVRRAGLTSALAAGTVAAGLWLHNREERIAPDEALVLPSFAVERPGDAPKMSIARGRDSAALVRAAIAALGGIGAFIGKGDVVVLKPNVAFDRPPSVGATTRPEVLRAVVDLCFEAGAREVRVTDNPISNPEACFDRTGIAAALKGTPARVFYPVPRAFRIVDSGSGTIGKWSTLFAPFEGATKVIGIAPCKDHSAAGASMTMKNWYGLMGGRRDQFHQQIHSAIAGLARMVTPTLVILDAIQVMVRNGPTGGSPSDLREANTIVAGTDQVAVDAFGNRELLGRRIGPEHYIALAHEQGTGTMRFEELNPVEVSV